MTFIHVLKIYFYKKEGEKPEQKIPQVSHGNSYKLNPKF